MDIQRKIEEIRRQPEHIRLRYVWGGVAISMFFVILIWIFSLSDSIKNIVSTDNSNLPGIEQNLDEIQKIKDSAPSINEIANNPEGKNAENTTNEQNLTTKEIQNNQIPKEEPNSNLPGENPPQDKKPEITQ